MPPHEQRSLSDRPAPNVTQNFFMPSLRLLLQRCSSAHTYRHTHTDTHVGWVFTPITLCVWTEWLANRHGRRQRKERAHEKEKLCGFLVSVSEHSLLLRFLVHILLRSIAPLHLPHPRPSSSSFSIFHLPRPSKSLSSFFISPSSSYYPLFPSRHESLSHPCGIL